MNFFKKYLRYWHTVRNLRFIQIYYRIYFSFTTSLRIKISPVKVRNISAHPIFLMHKRNSLISKSEFLFFNKIGDINTIGWNPKNYKKLWVYNLHYFDFLNIQEGIKSNEYVSWQKLIINRWIDENPYPNGIGWDSYPTSLRIVNWAKWVINDNPTNQKMIQSLNFQTEWLFRRIEWHLLGNHLFSNAKALLFSGILLEGRSSSKWTSKAFKIIDNELKEQILDDGGNFELSPMYHAIFLEDLLDIIQLSISFPDSFKKEQIHNWKKIALKMIDWLEVMTHKDGQIALFNDSALNVSSSTLELIKYANSLGILESKTIEKDDKNIKLVHLKNTGYIKLSDLKVDIFIDIADVGPSYLPAHAHADTLSFELSFNTYRIFVNGGTSTYELGEKRNRERMTSSHNTVVLNDQNSSDVWNSFRVGRRARPYDLKISQKEFFTKVSCSHNGYKHINGKPVHNREWYFEKNKLLITDKISGKYNSAIAHYIIHPDVKIIQKDSNRFILKMLDGNEISMISSDESELIDFQYSPYFGNSVATKAIKIKCINKNISCSLEWD